MLFKHIIGWLTGHCARLPDGSEVKTCKEELKNESKNKDVYVSKKNWAHSLKRLVGKKNIRAVRTSCSSRLRLTLNDKKVVNEAELKILMG